MLTVRLIPCLDVDDGMVVKGVRFRNLIVAGDPVELAKRYYDEGADELAFLDVGASVKSRKTLLEVVEKISSHIFIPLTAGGGVRSISDIRKLLLAGADKVAICTSALERPFLIKESAEEFGSQCVVLSIDAKRTGDKWHAFSKGGTLDSGIDAIEWAIVGESLGAGEILLNSIDRDGTKMGYDLELLKEVNSKVRIPVIASGGAGNLEQIFDAIAIGKIEAVLLASTLHFGELTIPQIKQFLKSKGVNVR
ncbi:MAG: imidazole glycerol phosphate synthase subunit HisF [Candidatus Aminicenantia bacterium]